MTDLPNENNAEEIREKSTEQNIDSSSERGIASTDRLSAVKILVDKANKDAGERISERERSAREAELESEKRLADAKAKIAENAAQAERLAEERIARMEYSGEYRQRLMARENKRAAEEKRRREEAEKEADRIKAEERAREIEEFIRLEKEAAIRRAKKSEEMISSSAQKIENEEDHKPLGTLEIQEEKTEEPIYSESCEQAQENIHDENVTPDSDGVTQDSDNIPEDKAEDGKILLVINPGGAEQKKDDDDSAVIHIGGAQYASVMHAPYVLNHHLPEQTDRELIEAEKRHAELKLAAVSKAAGVYMDEIRLLEEEELRYNREIEEIQARRIEYAEHREYMGVTDDALTKDACVPEYALNDELAQSYDEFSDSRFMSERLSTEDELARYEKYKSQELGYAEQAQLSEQRPMGAEGLAGGFVEPAPIPPEYADYTPEISAAYDSKRFDGHNPEELARYEESLEAKQLSDTEEEVPEEHLLRYHLDNTDGFAKVALIKKLSDYRKSERTLTKKIKRISAKQNSVSHEEKTALIVEKIGVRKEITELSVEALTACVYARAKFKAITYKRILLSNIKAYNAACDEYEAHTGRPLAHISEQMANEVAEGRISDPIPNVYYYGNESYSLKETDGISLEDETAHRLSKESAIEESELHRLLSENYTEDFTRSELRERDKRSAEKMSAIKRATERDLLLVGLRQDYRLARFEAERDMLAHSFSTNKKQKSKRLAALEHKIDKIRRDTKRALKLERDDNSRYYMLLAMDGEKEKTKKRANRERLNALKMRLEVLLSEREEINERLIALYGGTDKKLTKTKINRKAGGVRKKHARAMYRKQRSLADRIDRIKAPLDMKEKAYALLNKKTACVATIEESYYKLRRLKPEGRAKRELLTDIKRAKSSMKTVDADVKFLIKKMKRHQTRREEDRRWGKFLVFLVLLLAAAIALWYFFADDVTAYFTELFDKLGGR